MSSYGSTAFYGSNNALLSSNIDDLLAIFVALGPTPPFYISLQNQTPIAPPSPQGQLYKAALEFNGITVYTD